MLAARPLYVESLTLLERPDADHAVLELVCGKGGYVRSIARDLGDLLGCHAHVVSLRRIWSGPFDLDDAIDLDDIAAGAKDPALDAHLLPMETGLTDLPQVILSAEGALRIANGNPGAVVSSEADFGDLAWASFRGQPVAVGVYKAGALHPSRVFRL